MAGKILIELIICVVCAVLLGVALWGIVMGWLAYFGVFFEGVCINTTCPGRKGGLTCVACPFYEGGTSKAGATGYDLFTWGKGLKVHSTQVGKPDMLTRLSDMVFSAYLVVGVILAILFFWSDAMIRKVRDG